jgi:hypothetical protein
VRIDPGKSGIADKIMQGQTPEVGEEITVQHGRKMVTTMVETVKIVPGGKDRVKAREIQIEE